MGYSRNQILLAKALIDHDLIGSMLVSIDRRTSTPDAALRKGIAGLQAYASSVPNMDFATFGKIQSLYYIADAGSYPWLWTGRVFNFGNQSNQNCPDPDQICSRNGAFERLQRVMAGKESLPPPSSPPGGLPDGVAGGSPAGGNPAAANPGRPPTPTPSSPGGPFFLDGNADNDVAVMEQSLQQGDDLGGMVRDISSGAPYSSGPIGALNP